MKKYYNKYYHINNMVISVVSSISFEEVIKIVENYFKNGYIKEKEKESILYEKT
ncbi:insulinase family protein [Clostridium senegalense]|uniref:insulinase family protein n=1 Tax=Clostridium senegalense TaxID=1465809 RepID=UPI000289E594|nr:insulinase family protein [Clostridium senegalense]